MRSNSRKDSLLEVPLRQQPFQAPRPRHWRTIHDNSRRRTSNSSNRPIRARCACLTWIGDLAKDGPWYIISIDRFKKQHGAEREAIRRAGHTVFILDAQWSKHEFWLQAARLVRWWPQIVAYSALVSGGAYRVPWQHSPTAKLQAIGF